MYVNTGMSHGLAWPQMRINKGHIRNLHDRAVSFAIVMLGLRAGAETLRALENPEDGNLYVSEAGANRFQATFEQFTILPQ